EFRRVLFRSRSLHQGSWDFATPNGRASGHRNLLPPIRPRVVRKWFALSYRWLPLGTHSWMVHKRNPWYWQMWRSDRMASPQAYDWLNKKWGKYVETRLPDVQRFGREHSRRAAQFHSRLTGNR